MAETRTFIAGETIRADLQRFYEKPVTRVSLELLLSLLAVIFFALFALRPTLNTMSRLVREIEEKRKIEEALTRKVAALSTAQNEFFTFQDRLPILDTAIHNDLSLENALFYLEYLAAESGVTLSSVQIKEFPFSLTPTAEGEAVAPAEVDTSKKEVGIHAVQVAFVGDYNTIIRFFRTVESIRPLFAVQGFSISVETQRDEVPTITANATLLFYGYQTPQREERDEAPTRTVGAEAIEGVEGAEE